MTDKVRVTPRAHRAKWAQAETEHDRITTRVVHCKREKFDVYIGRPSKWGNPFKLAKSSDAAEDRTLRADLLVKYEGWLRQQPELIASLHELRGKVLGCWCAPRLCHGDVLARLANEPSIDELIERSSLGAGLRNIRENGIEAELADLDREMRKGRR
jgi:hypothetical protein